jgi:hypothetical protein
MIEPMNQIGGRLSQESLGLDSKLGRICWCSVEVLVFRGRCRLARFAILARYGMVW